MSGNGVEVEPEKIRAVSFPGDNKYAGMKLSWLSWLLQMVYRELCQDYITSAQTDGRVIFAWDERCELAFEKLDY